MSYASQFYRQMATQSMVKLVDTYALGAYAVMRVGSNPDAATIENNYLNIILNNILYYG